MKQPLGRVQYYEHSGHGKNIKNDGLSVTDTNIENNVTKSNKCNQCDYASSYAHHLRTHLKAHSGEKLNKCNQCDYASSSAHSLRRHLKTHSGEKSNKCNQCDFASSQASNLRTHLKKHSGEKSYKCNQLCILPGRPFEDTSENT